MPTGLLVFPNTQSGSVWVVVGALLLVAAYFFTAFIHGQFFYIFATFLPYYFMLPTFVMVRAHFPPVLL